MLFRSELAVDTVLVLTTGALRHTMVFVVHGVNDAATFSGEDAGLIVEDAATGMASVTGTLVVRDVDGPDEITPGVLAGDFGTLGIDADGAWRYVADDGRLQRLNVDAGAVDSFTVHAHDGTAHVMTFTLVGINDQIGRAHV